MKTDTSEYGLESLIVKHMTSTGWIAGAPSDYDRAYAVDLVQLCEFIKTTKEPLVEAFDLEEGGPSRLKFLARLQGEITKRGTIDVLRNGIKSGPHHVDLFYGTPTPGSYRVEKHAAMQIQLADENAEIEPVPTGVGGSGAEAELDKLSNIVKAFNDQFGNIPWADSDRVNKLITEDIPAKVDADPAHQNAKKQGDKSKARIEHDAALGRVILGLLNDDTELFKQWSDNAGFKRWLADTVFGLTYDNRIA